MKRTRLCATLLYSPRNVGSARQSQRCTVGLSPARPLRAVPRHQFVGLEGPMGVAAAALEEIMLFVKALIKRV